jgi:hypothetical protein
MEQLIIFIILGIVASFFSSKNKKEATEKGPQPKPFMATGRAPDSPTTKLKEMSKELYRELQKEMAGEAAEPPSRQLQRQQPATTPLAIETAKPARSTAERTERTNSSSNRHVERPDSSVNRHSGRLSAHGGKRQSATAMETHHLMPRNQEDLLKGIVFSEIFGPPKSKQ